MNGRPARALAGAAACVVLLVVVRAGLDPPQPAIAAAVAAATARVMIRFIACLPSCS
jgi:hypothetical protein